MSTLSRLSVQPDAIETKPLRLLVVSESGDWPLAVREMVTARGIRALRASSYRQACDPALLSKVDAVVACDAVSDGDSEGERSQLQLLADALVSHRLTGVHLSPGTSGVVPDDDAITTVLSEVSAEELWGRVATIRQYRPLLRKMDRQVAVMQRLGKKLNQQFVEVDQELRLASRLQRDFLPKSLPRINDVQFAALYRPASWVSGDMYDVCRLDETHVGFYLADAVGHGIAAGLLTMFIKQAVVGKRIEANAYRVVPPSEVLAKLNAELAHQELPNCQFVTALYAHINTETRRLTFARGGHPHPVHVGADGECVEVRTVGGLLGVFMGETYPSTSLQLEPGEKFIIYSDGLEDLVITSRDRHKGRVEFTPEFRQLVRQPIQTCMESLATRIDGAEGSIQPFDDMTVLGVERQPA